jgi:restriction system protein
MEKKIEQYSKSKQTAIKTLYSAFKAIKKAGGELHISKILENINNELKFTQWELEKYESNGQSRWLTMFYFYTIDCVKAGFLVKKKGIWYITKEGEDAFNKGPIQLFELANKGYQKWDKENKINKPKEEPENDLPELDYKTNIEDLENQAFLGIKNYIDSLNPYEFQTLAATLLGAMGYHIAFDAPRGPDGGIDIIAYNDPLGTIVPRILVQVKHHPNTPISSSMIQNLIGSMPRQTDVGIYVTSGSFSKNAIKESRTSQKHIELIDVERFIELWQEYYPKMTDEDKDKLPLHAIYFLGDTD